MVCKHKFHLVGFGDISRLTEGSMETVKMSSFVCESCGFFKEVEVHSPELNKEPEHMPEEPEEPKKPEEIPEEPETPEEPEKPEEPAE